MSYGKIAHLVMKRIYESENGSMPESEQPVMLDVTISQLQEAGDSERVYVVRMIPANASKQPITRTFIDRDKKPDVLSVVIKSLQAIKGTGR